MHSYREAKQLRTFLSKCFMGTCELLQISHGNLLILVKGLSLCSFPVTQNQLHHVHHLQQAALGIQGSELWL